MHSDVPSQRSVQAGSDPVAQRDDGSPPATGQLTTSTVNSLVWLFSSNAVGSVARLAIVPIMARLLVPEAFGLAAAASVVSGFANIFSTVGIGPALIRLDQVEKRHLRTGLTISMGLGILAWAIVMASAPWIAGFFNSPALIPILYVQAFLFPLRGLGIVCESMLQREMAFRQIALFETVAYVVGYCLIAVIGALAGWGVWAIVAGVMVSTILRTLLAVLYRPQFVRFGFDRHAARSLWRDGSGFTAMRTLSYFRSQIDYVIVGRLLGMDVLGLYTKSYELISRPAHTLAHTISRPLFAGLTSIQNERLRVQRAFLRGMTLLSLVIMPLVPFGVILSREIVLVVLGSQWVEAIVPFGFLAPALYFMLASRTTVIVLQARGVLLRGTLYYLVSIAAIALGAWIGHFWGIAGVAVGVSVALAVSHLFSSALALQNLGLGWAVFAKAHLHGLLLAVLSTGLVWAIAAWLRPYDQMLVTLLVALAAVGLTALLLLWLAPRRLLGEDGVWAAHWIAELAGKGLRRMRGARKA